MKLRCLIVEDHEMFLELLLIALATIPAIEISHTAKCVAEAEAVISERRFDLAILDYALPDGTGLDLARTLRRTSPNTSVLMLTAHMKSLLPHAAVDASAPFNAIIDKIGSIDLLSAEIYRIVGERSPDGPGSADSASYRMLTTRELQVFRLLGEGLSNRAVGERMGISLLTVETHRKLIVRKTGWSGAALMREAVLYRNGTLASPLPSRSKGRVRRPPPSV